MTRTNDERGANMETATEAEHLSIFGANPHNGSAPRPLVSEMQREGEA